MPMIGSLTEMLAFMPEILRRCKVERAELEREHTLTPIRTGTCTRFAQGRNHSIATIEILLRMSMFS
jgi:hypothetical protein